MKTDIQNEYESGLDVVLALFRDPDFHIRKFESMGDRNITVLDSHDDENEFWIRTSREVRADVPGMLKKILGE